MVSCLFGPQLEEQLGLDSSTDFFGGDKGSITALHLCTKSIICKLHKINTLTKENTTCKKYHNLHQYHTMILFLVCEKTPKNKRHIGHDNAMPDSTKLGLCLTAM